MKKIDVNLLDKDEHSDMVTPESEKSENVKSETDHPLDSEIPPSDTALKQEEAEIPDDVPVSEDTDVKEEISEPKKDEKRESGLPAEGGGGNGSKPPEKKKTGRNIIIFLIFLLVLAAVLFLTRPEFVPGFSKLSEDTVLVVEKIETPPVTPETQEFSIIPAEDEKAADTLKRIRKAMDGAEKTTPENLEILKDQMAKSRERLNRLFVLSRHFQNGLFWSYYSTSSGVELLEMKANEVGLFERYFNRVMENKLFDSLNFFSYDGKYWDSLKGVFVGSYTSTAKPVKGPLYTMSAGDFLDYVGYAAQKAGVNFTDRNSSTGKSVIPGTKQTVYELTFYGTINQLADFTNYFLEIPATCTILKVIAGRRFSDSYPDPLKLTLFVSLFEKE